MRLPLAALLAAVFAAVFALGTGCATIDTVRLQPETVDVGPGLRPVAGIQATASTFYFLFIPIPGDVNLDRLVNRMLIVTAKKLGADKVAQVHFHLDCATVCFSRIFGSVQGDASGIAVQLTGPPADPLADEGPEPHLRNVSRAPAPPPTRW